MDLARRIGRIKPSITFALDARAKALVAEGHNVVNMAVGQPDFGAPRVAREAAIEAVSSGNVRYTPPAGTPELRKAIASYLGTTRAGTAWSPDQITVCHSAKHALSATLMTLVQRGDEVLIPLPAWSSYVDQVRITGAEPVMVPSPFDATGFHPDIDALRAATGPRTRALIINSPNNPSGTVWTPDEIHAIAEFAIEHDLWLIADEIYRELLYDGTVALSPSMVSEEARERTILVDGASKCFAMTGYRIGFVAAAVPVAAAVAKLGSQTNGSPNAVGQAAYRAALQSRPPELDIMCAAFAERRDLLLGGLAALGLETPSPRGAFYAFPNVAAHLDERGSIGFCGDLLERERLALVPGSAFGVDAHVRLSYAMGLDGITEALRRLRSFLG